MGAWLRLVEAWIGSGECLQLCGADHEAPLASLAPLISKITRVGAWLRLAEAWIGSGECLQLCEADHEAPLASLAPLCLKNYSCGCLAPPCGGLD